MADVMRDIDLVKATRSKKSVLWEVAWSYPRATVGGSPDTVGGFVKTRDLPAPEFQAACRALAREAQQILGIEAPESVKFSSVRWGDEKNDERAVTLTVLVQDEDLRSPVGVALNLRAGVATDELLELERRAFAFADRDERAQAELELEDASEAPVGALDPDGVAE